MQPPAAPRTPAPKHALATLKRWRCHGAGAITPSPPAPADGPSLSPVDVIRITPRTPPPPGANRAFSSGHPGGDAARARKALNAATIAEMHRAFREGGRAAILKVMRQQAGRLYVRGALVNICY